MVDCYPYMYAPANYPRGFVLYQRTIQPMPNMPPGVVSSRRLFMQPRVGVPPYDAQGGEGPTDAERDCTDSDCECECECDRNVRADAFEAEDQQCRVELEERQQRLFSGDAELEQREQRLQARDAELEQREQSLQARDAELEQREQRLQARDAELEERQQRLFSGDAELEQREQRLQARDAELQQARACLLYTSPSPRDRG